MNPLPKPPRVRNFGANLVFQPLSAFQPATEAELLVLMNRHRGRKFRVIGRLHSWSEAPVATDVLLDLRHFSGVEVQLNGDSPTATVGAGCQIKRILAELQPYGLTLPALGLVTEQSIAGAMATGTHGSGRSSLSHYAVSMRIAGFSLDSDQAVIREVSSAPELLAARCALGCLGVVTSVQIPVRPQYFVEEHFQSYATLQAALDQERQFPLQQFFLIPWHWSYFAQHRCESDKGRSRLASLYRLYWALGMDIGLHLNVWALVRLLPAGMTKSFFRKVVPRLVPQGWKVVDRSDRQLTTKHERFRHIEIEIFVAQSKLAGMIEFVTWLLMVCGGEIAALPPNDLDAMKDTPLFREAELLHGTYVHHYPVCIRKVLPDDTLISVTSDSDEPWYALSFISYASPDQRQAFMLFASVLARFAARLFGARPHWGKVCPLPPAELCRLYPRLPEFTQICESHDPDHAFLNDWLHQLFTEVKKPPRTD